MMHMNAETRGAEKEHERKVQATGRSTPERDTTAADGQRVSTLESISAYGRSAESISAYGRSAESISAHGRSAESISAYGEST